MKGNTLASLALTMLLATLLGCGGGGSDAPSSTAPLTDPSTTEMPYGVKSMSVPYDGLTIDADYVYDENGQVVAVSVTNAADYDGDGRDDYVQTADITIDPSITPIDPPEFDDTSADADMSSFLAVALRGDTFGPGPAGLSTTLNQIPGAVTHVESQRYSYAGRLILGSVADDMITEQSIVVTNTYDAGGRLIAMDNTWEDSDVLYTYRYTFTYDEQGRMTRQKRVDQRDDYKDGWIDAQSISEITYAHDASGKKVSKVEDIYNDSYLRTTTYTYDASGLLTGEDYKRVERDGETVADHNTIAYAYDTDGRMIEKVVTHYTNDGDVETPSSLTTIDYSYDDSGRLVEKVREYDGDADPSTQNAIYTDTYAYGQHGLTTYEYGYEDVYGNGSTYTYEMSYNTAGQLTEIQRACGSDNDGVADHFHTYAYAYDADGRLVSQSYAYQPAVDGEPDAATDRYIYAFSYDADGRLVGYSYEDYDNGTDMDEQMVASLAYDAAGTGASGTVEGFSLDDATGTLTSDGPAQTVSFTFAAEAPTAAMAITVQEFPYSSSQLESFEAFSLTVDIPALYGLYSGWQMMSADN